jgi:hypothetical protein
LSDSEVLFAFVANQANDAALCLAIIFAILDVLAIDAQLLQTPNTT